VAYSSDVDLINVKRDILSLGVGSWLEQHDEAQLLIDRDLEVSWFLGAAKERQTSDTITYQFNSALLEPTQLKRLSIYKTLELAYLFLAHEYESDPFRIEVDTFKQRYNDELLSLLAVGVKYDWNEDATYSVSETQRRSPRLLRRI